MLKYGIPIQQIEMQYKSLFNEKKKKIHKPINDMGKNREKILNF